MSSLSNDSFSCIEQIKNDSASFATSENENSKRLSLVLESNSSDEISLYDRSDSTTIAFNENDVIYLFSSDNSECSETIFESVLDIKENSTETSSSSVHFSFIVSNTSEEEYNIFERKEEHFDEDFSDESADLSKDIVELKNNSITSDNDGVFLVTPFSPPGDSSLSSSTQNILLFSSSLSSPTSNFSSISEDQSPFCQDNSQSLSLNISEDSLIDSQTKTKATENTCQKVAKARTTVAPTVTEDKKATPTPMETISEMKPLNKSPSKVYGQPAVASPESQCKICSKHVYHMEQIKAAKAVFHKACFRCVDCSKPLSLDTYSSHEGRIYCKPHFKQIFQPQPVFTTEPNLVDNGSEQVNGNTVVGNCPTSPTERAPERKKYELIIAENQPLELPADVVRSSTRNDEVFENINLDLSNIRNRFELASASNTQETHLAPKKQISRAENIHKIMQRYQNRVSGERDMSDEEETSITAPTSAGPDSGPDSLTFTGLSSLKSQWETGNVSQKSESVRLNDELEEIRAKAKSAEPIKNAYERALQEKQQERLNDVHVESGGGIHASGIKEKFEKGQFEPETEEDLLERMRKEREAEMDEIARSETSTKQARNKFKQIEQGVAQDGSEVVTMNGNHSEEVSISSQELQNRFAYFENIREFQQSKAGQDCVDDCPKVDTTKKMLDKFKAMESGQNVNTDEEFRVRKITPPRQMIDERKIFESEPIAEDPNIVKSSYKSEEKIEVEPEKAKNLRAKFENWQSEMKSENRKHADEEEEFVPTNGTSKNLRAIFESIKAEGDKPIEKPRPRINRFVESSACAGTESCFVCSNRLYAMEKMEFSGIKIHKNCFRCNKCHCMLRLDNFTMHAEKLFCIPHFKQLFMEKGNYDEGFGLEQHKDKWSNKSIPASPAHSIKMVEIENYPQESEHENELECSDEREILN